MSHSKSWLRVPSLVRWAGVGDGRCPGLRTRAGRRPGGDRELRSTSLPANRNRFRGWAGLVVAMLVGLEGRGKAAEPTAPPPLAPSPASTNPAEPGPVRFEFSQVHMGTQFKLVFYAPTADLANQAAERAFARIGELDQALSDYRDDSELMRFCRTAGQGQSVQLSDDLWTVLVTAQALAERSGGAFDVTCGPVVRQWRRARRQKQLPDPDDLVVARRVVGFQNLILDSATRRGHLVRPDMRLDLGGIAQGFAADEALRRLAEMGISRAVVDSSGDVALGEPPGDAAGWRVAVPSPDGENRPPLGWLTLARGAVSTSGDIYQHVVLDGKRFSHLVDPRTGWALADSPQVTVLIRPSRSEGPAVSSESTAPAPAISAGPGMLADALATAVSVLGWEAGQRLVAEVPGGELLYVERVGERWIERATPGFWGPGAGNTTDSAVGP